MKMIHITSKFTWLSMSIKLPCGNYWSLLHSPLRCETIPSVPQDLCFTSNISSPCTKLQRFSLCKFFTLDLSSTSCLWTLKQLLISLRGWVRSDEISIRGREQSRWIWKSYSTQALFRLKAIAGPWMASISAAMPISLHSHSTLIMLWLAAVCKEVEKTIRLSIRLEEK